MHNLCHFDVLFLAPVAHGEPFGGPLCGLQVTYAFCIVQNFIITLILTSEQSFTLFALSIYIQTGDSKLDAPVTIRYSGTRKIGQYGADVEEAS